VIDVKFDSLKGGWCSKEVLGTFGVNVWKHIRIVRNKDAMVAENLVVQNGVI
jgi:hypothetical protein